MHFFSHFLFFLLTLSLRTHTHSLQARWGTTIACGESMGSSMCLHELSTPSNRCSYCCPLSTRSLRCIDAAHSSLLKWREKKKKGGRRR